jgi:hypothetical protein
MRIIKIIYDIVTTMIICKIAQTLLIKKAENQLEYSSYMLKMIPIWLVNKNNKIKKII